MKYRVQVTQYNVFWIDSDEAESIEDAKRIATEDRIWDENLYNYGGKPC
jgi:hypothetical protein